MPTDPPPFGKAVTAPADAGSVGVSQMVRDLTDLPAIDRVPDELRGLTQYADFKELGRGGMGVVYVARNTLMDRPEVLKVAQVGADRERFLREMRAAAKLQHPNVVTAYTAIPAGDRLVFAMEYAAGEDLARVVRRKGPLPVHVACYYAHCAALGLQHAHENGMVHRDIKPGNLILTRVNGKTVVKVLDFGLAKPTAAADLTGSGQLMGTPDYIAPEQALDVAAADTRADIYSLGCTLYCLLAGDPPFKAAGGLMGKVDAHRYQLPRPLVEVRPDVPAGLSAVVARMLAKRPEDRYQTPAEAAAAVRPFTAKPKMTAPTSPETVRPKPTVARLRSVRRPPRRWRWWVSAAAAGVLLLAAGWAWLPPRATSPPEPGGAGGPSEAVPIDKPPPDPPAGPPPGERVLYQWQSGDADKGVGVNKLRLTADGLIRNRLNRPLAGTWELTDAGNRLVLRWTNATAPGGQWVDTYTSADGVEFRGTNNGVPPRRLVGRLSGPPSGEPEPAAESRFEGGVLSGFDPAGGWVVSDGVLRSTAVGSLLSTRTYTDFAVDLEFRIEPDTAASVDLWAQPGDVPLWVFLDNTRGAMGAVTHNLRGGQFTVHRLTPKAELRPSGEWNELRVEVRDPMVAVTLNGRTLSHRNIRDHLTWWRGGSLGPGDPGGRVGLTKRWGRGALLVRKMTVAQP